MKIKTGISSLIPLVILTYLLLPTKLFADWAYSFVVYDGYTYVISDEVVTEIDEVIGKVTKYSDREGTYYGNFSNTFEKGTKYYSLKGISTDEVIAIENSGIYIKAIRKSEYAGGKYSPFEIFIGGLAIFVVFTILLLLIRKMFIRN